ncbi:Pr6Pr family membrane protein [Pseudoxanthomonas sp. SL93]|uniref:Pr6Pr family membrane protein n=1 Tax=Pseudoxanthomonas sp. SL93 TaxID=2995142 RepID=UPI002270816D|nr:Pr6Pr family membrane protein [Pseudoxanthomonas sp. SL93]WAC64691.1 Pr6Pr family membrane protein [Pseudoxanthomonas sp. SL93]
MAALSPNPPAAGDDNGEGIVAFAPIHGILCATHQEPAMPDASPLSPATRWSAALVCAVSLASLVLQYVLILQATRSNIGPLLGSVRFFSYFTILSNIAVALVTLHGVLARDGFFARARVRAAVALYIGVTGLVYTFVLSKLWEPQGAQWWADSGLHYATPLLYGVWWLGLVPHGTLTLRDVVGWLVFPALYTAWVFLRGAWVDEYPYPFLDVGQLGWMKTLLNSTAVLLLFLLVGVLLVALDRALARRNAARPE